MLAATLLTRAAGGGAGRDGGRYCDDPPRYTIIVLKGLAEPFALTDNGHIAGSDGLAPAVWYAGSATLLLDAAGDTTAINVHGVAVGWVMRDNSTFIYRDGKMLPLQPTMYRARGINDAGDIVGSIRDNDGPEHPSLWRRGKLTDLLAGQTHWVRGEALAINRHGAIVGYVGTGDNAMLPAAFARGGAKLLPLPPGFRSGAAFAVNDDGDVAGNVGDALPGTAASTRRSRTRSSPPTS